MGLDLRGSVTLDGSGFETGIHKLNHMGQHAFGELKSFVLGAFGAYTAEQMFQRSIEKAKELVNASKRLGVGVEQLQLLKQAAKDSSTDLGALEKAFEKIDIAREKALGNSPEGQKHLARFGQLGITRGDLQSQTAGQLFANQMRAAANRMSEEDLGPILRDILGKGFGEIIPVLKTNFDELGNKMRETGAIMEAETAVKLKAFGDELELISQIILTHVGPALLQLGENLYRTGLKALGGWAATAAAIGGGTGKMSNRELVGEIVKALASPALVTTRGLAALFGGAKLDEALMTGVLGPNFDAKAAKQAGVKAIDARGGRAKELNAALARLAAQAKGLEHPVVPHFEGEPTVSPAQRPSRLGSHGDALVRVRNFLGAGRDAVSSIAERQTRLLQEIATNTRRDPHARGGAWGLDAGVAFGHL